MKKIRIKDMKNFMACRDTINRCVKDVDGLETAHIDMTTGEISYVKGCVDEKLLREALAREGLELDEEK